MPEPDLAMVECGLIWIEIGDEVQQVPQLVSRGGIGCGVEEGSSFQESEHL